MSKLRTVTLAYEDGTLTLTGYYSPAYAGTRETPPEPSLFEVTDAFFEKDGRTTDIGHIPSDFRADGLWDKLGELARREIEQREYEDRMAYAERDE